MDEQQLKDSASGQLHSMGFNVGGLNFTVSGQEVRTTVSIGNNGMTVDVVWPNGQWYAERCHTAGGIENTLYNQHFTSRQHLEGMVASFGGMS